MQSLRKLTDKIKTLDNLAWLEGVRAQGNLIVLTNGCFDLLHRGHIEYLHKAREIADYLIVAVNGDKSTSILKGPNRPIVCEEDRLYSLAALECVDAVIPFNEVLALKVFDKVSDSVSYYVKGGDYNEHTLNKEEYTILKKSGCTFVFIPFVKGHSTTTIINKIKEI